MKKVYIVGFGVGNIKNMTSEAVEIAEKSDIIIGCKRVLDSLNFVNCDKICTYNYNDIVQNIEKIGINKTITIGVTGDSGFFSMATKLTNLIEDKCDVEVICGISSLQYFCSKIKTTWNDVKLISVHGRESSFINHIRHNSKIFMLTGSNMTVTMVCDKLVEAGMGDLTVSVGENLSYKNEKIVTDFAKNICNYSFDKLSVIMIFNSNTKSYISIKDEEFFRDKVPMTKAEVRTISIAKLELSQHSVIYDIGAGTGSISAEIAINIPDCTVYAIEKNPRGVELIKKNMEKFQIHNVQIVEGIAPRCLEKLEKPTQVFIGGSANNMHKILDYILSKNHNCSIVINTITLQSISLVMEYINKNNLKNYEVCQIAISTNKKISAYDMMIAQNPVYIIKIGGTAI